MVRFVLLHIILKVFNGIKNIYKAPCQTWKKYIESSVNAVSLLTRVFLKKIRVKERNYYSAMENDICIRMKGNSVKKKPGAQ